MNSKEEWLERCLIDELNNGTAQQRLQYETGRMAGFLIGMFLGIVIGVAVGTAL